MKINRNLNRALDCADQLGCRIRRKQTGHVLNTDRIRAHVLDSFGNIHIILGCISIAQGIADRNLRVTSSGRLLLFIRSVNCALKIPHIIQSIKDTDNIHTVRDGLLYEIFYHIIRIMTVSENILSAEQHLKLCILKAFSQLAESDPGILL